MAAARASNGPDLSAGQVRALDEAHGIERLPLVLPHFVDGDNMRVIQARRRLGLDPQPPREIRRIQRTRQDHLERHGTIQAQLVSPVDDPHAAAANLPLDPVVAEPVRERGVDDRLKAGGA